MFIERTVTELSHKDVGKQVEVAEMNTVFQIEEAKPITILQGQLYTPRSLSEVEMNHAES